MQEIWYDQIELQFGKFGYCVDCRLEEYKVDRSKEYDQVVVKVVKIGDYEDLI